jgi:hypothetical protein
MFSVRYKEHICTIRNNNDNSGYSNLMVKTWHTYGTVTDTVAIVSMERKSRHLNIFEKYYIYELISGRKSQGGLDAKTY